MSYIAITYLRVHHHIYIYTKVFFVCLSNMYRYSNLIIDLTSDWLFFTISHMMCINSLLDNSSILKDQTMSLSNLILNYTYNIL